jgi:hypothetical protein
MATGSPSASDIVYLFGDRFVREVGLGGEQLVYGGQKVGFAELAEQLLPAALVDLASKGYLGLELVEQKKMGLFTSRDVRLTRLGSPQETLHGLDAAVWDNLRGDPKKDGVRTVIARIMGGKRINPWSYLVDLAKSGLAEQGYLNAEKEKLRFRPDKVHWSANEELISPHQGRVDQVKAQLSSLESRSPALYEQLLVSVAEGIEAMREKPRTRR